MGLEDVRVKQMPLERRAINDFTAADRMREFGATVGANDVLLQGFELKLVAGLQKGVGVGFGSVR